VVECGQLLCVCAVDSCECVDPLCVCLVVCERECVHLCVQLCVCRCECAVHVCERVREVVCTLCRVCVRRHQVVGNGSLECAQLCVCRIRQCRDVGVCVCV
jgi:hypothetical protein